MLIVSNYKHPGRRTSGIDRPYSQWLHVDTAASTYLFIFIYFGRLQFVEKPLIDW